jgi:hypothetical protein
MNRGVKAKVFLGVLMLVLFPLSARASAEKAGDLDLKRRVEQTKPRLVSIKDPHGKDCADCHARDAEGQAGGPLLCGDDTIKLCVECHPDSNIHPVGMPPADSPERVKAIRLPMGKGPMQGKVVCLTCHDIHEKNPRRYLLRGDFSHEEDRRQVLCSECHGQDLKSRSPHASDTRSCRFCHTSPPKKGDEAGEMLKPGVQASCDFCHGAVDNGHYLAVNPFSDPDVADLLGKSAIPLLEGRFTCVSCHDPHAEVGRRKLLRDEYLRLASLSTKIFPHWKEVMCIACHDGEPEKGKPMLLAGGDFNRLCNRCHGSSKFTRREIHPVGIEPSSRVKIPAGMPLQNGKLTCETCHDSSLQEKALHSRSAGDANANFLRGGFTTRDEFCFRCHLVEQFSKLNAHAQLDENGEVREEICLFCHASRPDIKILGLAQNFFSADDPNEYCLGCHHQRAYLEAHPRGKGTHMVVPSSVIQRAIDTSVQRIGVELPLFKGKIICATCHNPHQEGVIQIDAAAKGSKSANKLRLNDGMMLCVGCHVNK